MTTITYSATRDAGWSPDRSDGLETFFVDNGKAYFRVGGYKNAEHRLMQQYLIPKMDDDAARGRWKLKLQLEIPRGFPKTLSAPLRLAEVDNASARLQTTGDAVGGSWGALRTSVGLTEERKPYVDVSFDSLWHDTAFPLWRSKKKLTIGVHEIFVDVTPAPDDTGLTVIRVDGAQVEYKKAPTLPEDLPDNEGVVTRVSFGIDAPEQNEEQVEVSFKRVEFRY